MVPKMTGMVMDRVWVCFDASTRMGPDMDWLDWGNLTDGLTLFWMSLIA